MYTLYMFDFENYVSVIHICFLGKVSCAQTQIRYMGGGGGGGKQHKYSVLF